MIGITHLAMGDTKNAVASREAITRTGIVLGHGAWQNIGTMPILGGVVTGDNSDALLIGWCQGVALYTVVALMILRRR